MTIRLGLLLLLLGASSVTHAQQEHIRAFHSDIRVEPDGGMTVRETITVLASGDQIRRGIYRDFPTTYRDGRGNRVTVGFEILGVTRNGAPEGYHTERLSNGVRIYFGHENYFLPDGDHTYQFTYRTTHQLGFFEDHDELYWNVTGNAWPFHIRAASAEITLPEGIAAAEVGVEGYTGAQGAKGQDYRAEVLGPGRAKITATRLLVPGEGLTVVVSFPKGFVREPSFEEQARFFIDANQGQLVASGGTLLILMYYIVGWFVVGRDPAKGKILPRETPPDGISPAAMRYLRRMGPDIKTFSAALVSMATKGYLRIDEESRKKYSIILDTPQDEVLSEEELAAARELFKDGKRVDFAESNHRVVGAAQRALTASLSDRYRGEYFNRHGGLVAIGIFASMATVFGGVALSANGSGTAAVLIGCVVALLITNVVFAFLLKAPTRKGRRVLDKIEGFAMYLRGEGTHRFSAQSSTEALERQFEQYLPFAIALGIEDGWADEFTRAVSMSSQPDRVYQPAWYYGSRWRTVGAQGFVGSLGGTFSGAVASSVTPPGSSSGIGGGGSSGGGGGGGGGGGW